MAGICSKLRVATASLIISALNLYGGQSSIDPSGMTLNINSGVLPADYGYATNGISAFFTSNLVVVGQNGVMREFDNYVVLTNYIVLDPYEDTSFYIKVGTFGNSEVGLWAGDNSYMMGYGAPVGTPTYISQGTDYTFSEGLSMEVGNWISTNSSFYSTNNSSKVFTEIAGSGVDPIFGDDIYFYMPPSAFTSTDTNEAPETEIELSYENLIIPFRTSKIETRIYNLYGENLQDYLKESVDYDTDVQCVINFNSPDIREIAEASINLEGTAGYEHGVLEFELYGREDNFDLHFQVSDDILPIGHTFEDIHIQAQLNHADNMYSIDILPDSLTADTIPDQGDCITMLRFSPDLDHIEFLYDESEEFNFSNNGGNWSLSGSTTPGMSGENFITNNARTYCVITNNSYYSSSNISFISLKLEASIEVNEDSEGNEITPTTTHPFSLGLGYNPTNLLGVSYLNVIENRTDLKVTVTNLPFALELPYDLQYDKGLSFLNNSDLVVNYFDGIHSNRFGLNGLYVMGTSEYYGNTNVLAENTAAYSNYNSRIQNGALARDPLNEINTALTEITVAYFNDNFTGTNGFDQASIVAGELKYQNGLLIKGFDFSIPDFNGINYTGTFSTVLSDSDITILESWFHADYVTQTSANELLQAISAIQATGSNFVYRFDPPESHNKIVIDWTLDLENILPRFPTNSNYMYKNHPYQLNHVYNLPNEQLLFIYPPDEIDVSPYSRGEGFGTNGVMITVLDKDGVAVYSINEAYIPYNATTNDMYGTPSRYIRANNLFNGSFSITHQFKNQMDSGKTIDGYTTLFIPTNNIYEKIVFDSILADPLFLKDVSAGTAYAAYGQQLMPRSWPSHNGKMYTFNRSLNQLTKYHIDLSHLDIPIDITGTNDAADIAAINTRVNKLESDVPALEDSLISYADASDTALSNSLIAQIDTSISGFSNSVDWASISSVDTNEINSRIDGVSYINTLLANEVSQEIQNRSAAITALQDEINILSGIVNNATNNSGSFSIDQAKSMMRDLRVGSSIIDVSNQQATITISFDQSSDLTSNWTENVMSETMTIPATNDVEFFRFRMD